MKNDIGLIGLAVMGSNLALNMADHGYRVSVYNRTTSVGEAFIEKHPHENIALYKELESFVESLEKPRKIILMVKAGGAVDKVIDSLIPLLDKEDIIMDGGNSYFQDTRRRAQFLEEKDIHYLGVGISGGEEGARFGPAIMPGGHPDAYQQVEPILTAISAKKNGEACSTYIGEDGAGHYVKMVHNGIEYADMQLIAESYFLLKHLGQLDNPKIAKVFKDWNEGELESYLIEITSKIFTTKDPKTDAYLVDMILDKAGQKGTGKWTVEEALNTGTDGSLLASAVFARFISSIKEERVEASEQITIDMQKPEVDEDFIEDVRRALYASKIIAYAQGFDLMKNAAQAYGWQLDFQEIAKIWREGCIIRAEFLDRIAEAYENKTLKNLMLADGFKEKLIEYHHSLRKVTALAIEYGISVPAFSSAVAYFDAYRSKHVSANLIQAQRDFFGAHTFERIDEEGHFHHEWGVDHEA